jgi:prolyl-tRNA synthetase
MSERVLGALIGVHGDNKGLIMPPSVAPIQVVIIPIIFKGKEKEVQEASEKVRKTLVHNGIRTMVDCREITPGNKYYEWELKGVPIRLEIGPKDIEKNAVMLVRRDIKEKKSIPLDKIEQSITQELDTISKHLYDEAKQLLERNTHKVCTVEEAKQKTGIVELPWCGTKECALEIESILDGNTLGEPIKPVTCAEPCPICGKPAVTWMRFAKSY